MRKLLSANNRAILNSKIFWMEVIFCVLFSVVSDVSDGAILNYYKAKDALYGRKRYEKLEMSRLPEFWEICFVFPSENFILCNLTNRIFSTIDGTEVSSVIEKYTEKNQPFSKKQ